MLYFRFAAFGAAADTSGKREAGTALGKGPRFAPEASGKHKEDRT